MPTFIRRCSLALLWHWNYVQKISNLTKSLRLSNVRFWRYWDVWSTTSMKLSNPTKCQHLYNVVVWRCNVGILTSKKTFTSDVRERTPLRRKKTSKNFQIQSKTDVNLTLGNGRHYDVVKRRLKNFQIQSKTDVHLTLGNGRHYDVKRRLKNFQIQQ